MDIKENSIQLKIDSIISEINQNNEDTQNEEKNQITALIGYNHCLDLYDFLKIYSKVQKNELLFQIAVIYDSIGYTELSMDYINESLLLIPNAPTNILYKCGLFVNQNKLDEAQKWLLKYKYLIGENKYDNYVHDSLETIFYYLLDYEEFIILRKIRSIEIKYSNYLKDNLVLYYIKSDIYEKLAQKIKNSDKKRYISYIKESNKIKNYYLRNKSSEIEFLKEQGIKPENFTKLLLFINPNCLNYRPKQLDEYKNNFKKSGFELFYNLFKICKILKLKIELKKYKKFSNQYMDNKSTLNNSDNTNLTNINILIKNIIETPKNLKSESSDLIMNERTLKECKESIRNLYNSVWLNNFINENNSIKINEIKNIDSKTLNINYFTKEGYYSHLNLDDNIIKYINYNKDYKQNELKDDLFLDEITLKEIEQKDNLNSIEKNNNTDNKFIVKNNEKSITINNANKSKTNHNSKNNIVKIIQKDTKTAQNNSSKFKRIKISLSDIIKKVITKRPRDVNNNNKRNKIVSNENEEKTKKYCSIDNLYNLPFSKSINNNSNKIHKTKNELNKDKKNEFNINTINIKKKEEAPQNSKEKEKSFEKKIEFNKKEENNREKNIKVPEKNNNNNNIFIGLKKKNIKNINNKNKILSTSSSNKKISIINSKDKSRTINKNIHTNPAFFFIEEKKMDTDYEKYKDVREINLVSYCFKQLKKKKESKNKKAKQKEIVNLTDKMDLINPQKMINFEKQVLQIKDQKYFKSRMKKKKFLNPALKNQINTFNYEKKIIKKGTQKNSQNNLLNSNKNSNSSNAINSNMKNLKKTSFVGNKKELSKFKSLNYLYGYFYPNNNFLNINCNNFLNYNFNYSNRHEDKKKNIDFKFNQNSDKKREDSSYSKEKLNFRTINLDFKNMSNKINTNYKKQLLSSFIDSKEKNKKNSEKKLEYVIMPFNKIKNSPSGEMYCLKKRIKNFKSNFSKQKIKTSFSKYMLCNMGKKGEAPYFSKSINTSEYSKYKYSSINNSKNMKNKYNKTINSKSNMKINNK